MRETRLLAAGAAVALTAAPGCHRRPERVVVICHNANCVGTNPAEDDTPDALTASLALLGRDGRPPIDGIEIDLAWSREDDRCVFAHALTEGTPTAPAERAGELIATHLRRPGPAARGDRFHLMIELKRGVDAEVHRHQPAERDSHAACALAVFATIRAAAEDAGVPINVLFESFQPDLLEALVAQPGWPGQLRDGPIEVRLTASFSAPAPLGYSQALPDFAGVSLDVVDVQPRWTSPGEYDAFDALGLQVSRWTASVTSELFDASTTSSRPTW